MKKELPEHFRGYKHVWVLVEIERGVVHPVSFELLGAGRKLADKSWRRTRLRRAWRARRGDNAGVRGKLSPMAPIVAYLVEDESSPITATSPIPRR